MADCSQSQYEDIIKYLLSIKSTLRQFKLQEKRERVLPMMKQLLERVNITDSDCESLNAIHVAGTKGKGSVCAMCESILRAQGLKTGLYSSPHLLEVRERIRINGQPLEKELFVKYFKLCLELLSKNKDLYHEEPLPSFHRFLGLMAFKVFLLEKVDVAIIEVGLGGRYDTTNVIHKPKVCGITSLGYDHVDVLGDTLSSIAWHKAGICKPDVPIYTSVQPPEALEMILSCSKEENVASVAVAPHSSVYPDSISWSIGIAGDHQLENASLSVQLCRRWMKDMGMWTQGEEKTVDDGSAPISIIPYASVFPLPQSFIKGLKECYWPGRCQVIKREGVSYYLDGAHTVESLQYTVSWYERVSSEERTTIQGDIVRILLFNFMGKRDSKELISQVSSLEFHHVLFAPNIPSYDCISPDQKELECPASMIKRCHDNEKVWHTVTAPRSHHTHVFECIADAIKWIETIREERGGAYIQVLVCGSLHLVGKTMIVLDYNIDSN